MESVVGLSGLSGSPNRVLVREFRLSQLHLRRMARGIDVRHLCHPLHQRPLCGAVPVVPDRRA